MKIKICGIQRLDDIDYVNEAKPDFIGFIFAQNSIRKITPLHAEKLKNKLSNEIKSVGVFLNARIQFILDVFNLGIIDFVQLHGSENNEYMMDLRYNLSIPIIKAFQVDENVSHNINNTYADYVLLDNKNGGSGKVFDWRLIPKIDKDFFLAGGLNINNIKEAMKFFPYALDINSGVEINGKKDREKILNIVNLIRGIK